MNTKQCSSCGQTIPFDARFCPACGAQFVAHRVQPKSMGCLAKIGIGFAALFGLAILSAIFGHHTGAGNSRAVPAASPSATPDPEADLRNRTAIAAGLALKHASRNPESLVLDDAFATKDGRTLCIEYRGQNGFGGMNREQAVFRDGKPRQGASYWNKHCVGNDFVNEKQGVQIGITMGR